MKRSLQEIVELVVFGLIALLVGTGVLWLLGWLVGLIGSFLMWLAGILWLVLRFVIPIVVIIAAVYALFRLLQRQRKKRAEGLGSQGASADSSSGGQSSGLQGGGARSVNVSPLSSSAGGVSVEPLPPSAVAGRPAGDVPAAAPITTPVSASGEPVSPLTTPEVEPLADEPVMVSGEPVPDLQTPPAEVDDQTVDASAEPVAVEVVEAEPVEPETDAKDEKSGKKKK